MGKEKFQRFGKYLILDHLVDGGMAKICRARHLGEQANKIVAVKMVQEKFSTDESFVQMFEDELKVTFGLLHPNIAQVYDYGMIDKKLYAAMEYVDGANLKQFLDRLKEKNFVFPVEISTYIISQVCQALHYAHTFTDKLSGKPFRIIHRDISPHNIMLAYDGAIKVIDFGIAKADSNSEATQAGTIKGKLSYLAPEYLEGHELDHRYDQFAVGITLWEMLCSRKLFTAKNDLAVLKLIQACEVPRPSSVNPNVPSELDEIVLKALSKDRNDRYENMDKFNRALVKFLYSNYPDFNATDLGYFAKQLFKEEITADKKKFVEYGKIDIKPYLDEITKLEKNGTVQKLSSSDNSDRSVKVELDFGLSSTRNSELEIEATGQTRKKKIKPRKKPQISKKESTSVKSNTTQVNMGDQSSSYNIFEPKEERKSSYMMPVAMAMVILLIVFYKVSSTKNSENTRQVSSKTEEIVSTYGVVSFSNYSPEMKIKVNGKVTKLDGIELKLKIGKEYRIDVLKSGYKKYSFPDGVELSAHETYKTLSIPELEEARTGFLSTSLNFSSGSKIEYEVDGDIISKDLPLKNERIPAGTYEAKISNPLLGTERKIMFTIEEDKRNFLK